MDPESEAARSNEVFQGRVRGYSEPLQNGALELVPRAVRRALPSRVWWEVHDRFAPKCHVELDVTRVFKGPGTPSRTVRLNGDCDWLPPPGGEWIVFGTREGLWVDVDMCTATGPIRDPESLAFLGPGRAPDAPAPRWQLLGILAATVGAASALCVWLRPSRFRS
jgi:hypothetical protein